MNNEMVEKQVAAIFAWLSIPRKWTASHGNRTSVYFEIIAQALGMKTEEIAVYKLAIKLHDLGKMWVPNEILYKKGPPDQKEWEIIKRHPIFGANILHFLLQGPQLSEFQKLASRIALLHHEKRSGDGYPYGCCGNSIEVEISAASIVDVFDALTSNRPYRERNSFEQAVAIFNGDEGPRTQPSHFHPLAYEAFLESRQCLRQALSSFTS